MGRSVDVQPIIYQVQSILSHALCSDHAFFGRRKRYVPFRHSHLSIYYLPLTSDWPYSVHRAPALRNMGSTQNRQDDLIRRSGGHIYSYDGAIRLQRNQVLQ